MNIVIWQFYLLFCLSLNTLTVNSSSYKDYKISYRVKIVANNHINPLVHECLITSVPDGYRVPKEESDIQYVNLIFKEGFSFCERPPKPFDNSTAILISSSTPRCGLVQQMRNARAANIKILVITSAHGMYLPDITSELKQYPIVVLMPANIFEKIDMHSLVDSRIGIYGSMGSSKIGDALTGLVLFGIVILTLVFIIFVTIAFNNMHFTDLENINTSESRSMKWLVVICPIMMVGTLLLMFYFYNALVWVLIIFFYFGVSFSIMSIAMLVVLRYDWLSHWIHPLNKYGIKNVDFRALGLFVVGLAVATAWIVNRNNMAGLVLNNIIGVFLCVEITVGFGIMFAVSKNFKLLLVLLAMTLVIDATMVYIPVVRGKAPTNFQVEAFINNDSISRFRRGAGESIMESVATGSAGNSSEELPIRFKIPRFHFNDDVSTARCQNYMKTYSMIGFGDIILPGAFIVYILTYAVMETGSVVLYSLFTLSSYIFGLVITYIVVQFTERGQPALVFLLPCTVILTILLTVLKRDLKPLWENTWPSARISMIADNDDPEMTTTSPYGDTKVAL